MTKLPPNFGLDRFGLHVRLVREEDAEFILKLRTDERLGRFIHPTSNDVEKQRQWIRDYKQREAQGIEYYFIYELNNERVGVNRLYDMKPDTQEFTSGSFVFKTGLPMEISTLSLIIMRDIAFDTLGYETNYSDVRLKNYHVRKSARLFGCTQYGETEESALYVVDKLTYKRNRQRLLKLLDIN